MRSAPLPALPIVQACTIAARNYLPQARILAASLLRHHPHIPFTALLVDDEDGQVAEGRESFRCWRLGRIGLDRDEIGRLAGYYDVTELATAIKPLFLKTLIEETALPVIYLDPDIKIFDALDEAVRLARDHGIVLTPHTTEPYPRDDRYLDEFDVLAAGVYNLGFIGVSPARVDFLDWWWARTRRDAFVDPGRMRFTDQRWVDFVPSLYEHAILKNPGYNVAYWNLHARRVTWTGTEYQVNDRPLVFFHFSGFEPSRPHLLSKHQRDKPRILLSEHPAVARLCREYVEDLHQASGFRATSDYGWERMAGGPRVDGRMRVLFREALVAAERQGLPEPPGPFHADGPARFLDWLRQPVDGGFPSWLSRYLLRIYTDRADVRQAFPDLRGRDAEGFLEWVLRYGATEDRIPRELLPTPKAVNSGQSEPAPAGVAPGLNIVGYFHAASGIGEIGRLVRAAADAAGIQSVAISAHGPASQDGNPTLGYVCAPYDVTLLCVNADQTPHVRQWLEPTIFKDRVIIGLWFWEVAWVSPAELAAFDDVDEVWVASEHVARALRPVARKPVSIFRPPLLRPNVPAAITRAALGLPNGLLFLFMFDFDSVFERKNPLAAIEAFSRAFAPNEGPTLVIKTINGTAKLAALEQLRAAAAGRPDVMILDTSSSTDERNGLLASCDCYVSLHRAEGLGLTMAEAMSLGKPVIATGYSGNLDFMTPDNALLVDYRMAAVPQGCAPYTEGTPWAEPSVAHAAHLMRRVYQDPELGARVGARAAGDIAANHSLEACAGALAVRLSEARERSHRRESPSIHTVSSLSARLRKDKSNAAATDRDDPWRDRTL